MHEIFISYRRGKGSDLASFFHSELTSKGFNCFLDVDTKYSGEFMSKVKKVIENSSLVIMIVTEGSLERFINPNDISRQEIEHALKHNIDILPISVIGDEMFRVIDEVPNLPKSAKVLKEFNTRLYKHELREDTINYIIELVEKLRKERFENISDTVLETIKTVKDKNLETYLKEVDKEMITIDGKDYIYTGKLKFNRPFGIGSLTDPSNGRIYKLDWNPYGELSGKGDVYKSGKLIYSGEIEGLEYNGQGKLFENDYTYEGMFKDSKPRGKGIMKLADGTVLSGEWLAGYLYTNSYIRYPNGKEYWGKTSDNLPNGYGIMIKEDGKKFDGFFRNGRITHGVMYTSDSIYLGTFTDEKPDGKGVMYNKNFEKTFEGVFKIGTINGLGKFYIKGKILRRAFVPKEIYDKLIQYYPNLDNMKLILDGRFEGMSFVDYDDFSIMDAESLKTICSGYIKDEKKKDYRYTIFVDYEEVYNNLNI